MQRYYQGQSQINDGVENISDRHAVLKQIKLALQMIEDGDYGLCEDCDDLILIQRLDMIPHAIRCTSCQENYEKKHGNPLGLQVPFNKKMF